jgi:muramoyltetrapeptide carboxypeptidase LdcA involved in peptidoglycan recycling
VIGLAAPAGPIDPERLEAGRRALCERGFEVVFSEDITERRGYLAGDDARRADELMRLVDDPAVGAIVCVRGGYGCQRIVESLDAARIRRAAKPLVGYSDITTLLLWQARVAGLGGIHGPMLERGEGFDAEALDALCESLQGDDRKRQCTRRRRGAALRRIPQPRGSEPRDTVGNRYPRRDPLDRRCSRGSL